MVQLDFYVKYCIISYLLVSMIICLEDSLLRINRNPQIISAYPEIKDPSVVHTPDGYYLFASIGSSVTQNWMVGRFKTQNLDGVWEELPPVTFYGIRGSQLCAPAVIYDANAFDMPWKMYIQTSCFEEDGIIVKAVSNDSQNFYGTMTPVVSKISLPKNPQVVGVYDAGVSELVINKHSYLSMLYSGYRKIGCGDIYLSIREKAKPYEIWTPGVRILEQEAVPFHNPPGYAYYEWGLEGAKIIQIGNYFLLTAVCFMPKPQEDEGKRQRIFFAVSTSLFGPYIPWQTVFEDYDATRIGEYGHPDIFIENNKIFLIYQQRDGATRPWYLQYATFDLEIFTKELTKKYPISDKPQMTQIPMYSYEYPQEADDVRSIAR